MKVEINFSDTINSTVDIDLAWQLFYLYQEGAKKAGENITAEREANWQIVENKLKYATEGEIIDFSLMGDIYFENGKFGFPED